MFCKNQLFQIAIIAFTIMSCSGPQTSPSPFDIWYQSTGGQCDTWIRGGVVYDGLDTVGRPVDVLIQNDLISFVGRVDTRRIKAEQVIEAYGKVVSPGFIDPHAHGNPLKTPSFHNFLRMGVTTICLGQDGSSPDTEDMGRWMKAVEDTIPGVNIAYFVGHGTLRQLSGIGFDSIPEPDEMAKMERLLESALDAGCWGLSTGLEYTPGIYAQEAELVRLAKIVGQREGMIMSHVRNEDADYVKASIEELLVQGKHANVHVSHLKVVYGQSAEEAQAILELLQPKPGSPYRVTADLYPYTASYTGIGIVFPKWAKAPNDYAKVKKERRAELLAFLRQKITSRNGPEATLFGTQPYAGKTLATVSAEMGRPYEEVLLAIGPSGASGAYFVMNEDLQKHLLRSNQVMIGSDGSPTMYHPRGYGTFAKIIEHYVMETDWLSLGTAIRKMTGLTAQTIGISDRGTIKAGQKADLLVFNPENVKAQATFTNPRQPALGFEWVILNGKIVIFEGAMMEGRSGKVLKRKKIG